MLHKACHSTLFLLLMMSSFISLAQPNIDKMEYFIDADPGRGLGVDIPVTPSPSIDLTVNVPTALEAEGFHLLTVRARDENGVWSLIESKAFFVSQSSTLTINNITKIEYFIDIDPGRGLGVDVPITSAASLDVLENVPTALETEGFHTITVRAQDQNGEWSLAESKVFYINQSSTLIQNNITKIEYFIDSDPGRGLGIDVPITSATSLDILENVPTALETAGFHTITVRAQDQNGEWSLAESKVFYINQSSTLIQNNITKIEYFIDVDPGRGMGVDVPITSATSLDILENVPTSGETEGFHTITIRAQDENGEWSLAESKAFYINQSSTLIQNNITKIEYFIDADSGRGMGVDVPITSATSLDVIENITTSTIAEGFHTLTLRAQDQNGEWSLAERKPFFVDRTRQIIAYEYAIDTDPGVGLATAQTITPQDAIDITFDIPTSAESLGAHNLILRVQDENGFWSKTEMGPFLLCDGGNAAFSADMVCVGSPTTFSDLSVNVLPTDTYSWDFDNDGFEELNTFGSTSFTYASAGSFVASLSVDRSGCASQTLVTVNVIDSPTSSVGSNQVICMGGTVNLTGLVGGNTSSSLWTTSGTGSFDDDTNPVAIYTPDAGDIASGSVTLTLTATGVVPCADAVSQTTITIQPPPTSNAGANQTVCSDAVVSLSGAIGGSATANMWTTSGTGTFVDPTNAITTYTPSGADITAGSLTLTLTASEPLAACTDATSQTTITINEVPAPTAGADQSLCSSDVANLAGAISGDFVAQSWSTSGTGTFDDNTSLIAVYTPSATDVTGGSVTLTLTATAIAPCVDVISQLVVSINSTIAVVEQSQDVSIGTPVNVDVFNGATSSSGDVLTTTIIQAPTKGTATILADGTFDYAALENNVGLDVIIFEVCNQCGNCDSDNAVMNILNEPPVIAVPTTTATAGSVVTISLTGQLSDINDNIDLSTLEVVVQPVSGAIASIGVDSELIVDYTGVSFNGTDELTLRVCDLLAACGNAVILIEVGEPGSPPVTVYNAISPNGDGKHDFLEIENIEFYPENKVTLFNRWGDVVYESDGYNNSDVAFKGQGKSSGELSAGTYYYSVDLNDGTEVLTGFVMLNK